MDLKGSGGNVTEVLPLHLHRETEEKKENFGSVEPVSLPKLEPGAIRMRFYSQLLHDSDPVQVSAPIPTFMYV
jgi:hypothetical protein